ncbi:hypothetical protein N7490_009487 [Penicillium lividum]|nr:hypothetical protein N7490_009487 [Penicillium lividum]
MRFKNITNDPFVFLRIFISREPRFIIIYVDDAFVIGDDQKYDIIDEDDTHVKIKDLGEPSKFLGTHVQPLLLKEPLQDPFPRHFRQFKCLSRSASPSVCYESQIP